MRFLDKPTCEKLVKMGCQSESNFKWSPYKEPLCMSDGASVRWYPGYPEQEMVLLTPAFTLEDFVSTDEYAQENRKIIFPDKFCIDCNKIAEQDCKTSHLRQEGDYYFLNEIVNSKDWVEFISEAVR